MRSTARGCGLLVALAAVGCGGAKSTPAVPRRTTPRAAPRVTAAPAKPTRTTRVLGYSTDGRPIRLTERVGARPGRAVLVVGAIHGTEPAGISVTRLLLSGPAPRSGTFWILQDINPDGRAAGARGNARGVDLNRNFPSQWRPIGLRGDPQYAGPRPLRARVAPGRPRRRAGPPRRHHLVPPAPDDRARVRRASRPPAATPVWWG